MIQFESLILYKLINIIKAIKAAIKKQLHDMAEYSQFKKKTKKQTNKKKKKKKTNKKKTKNIGVPNCKYTKKK